MLTSLTDFFVRTWECDQGRRSCGNCGKAKCRQINFVDALLNETCIVSHIAEPHVIQLKKKLLKRHKFRFIEQQAFVTGCIDQLALTAHSKDTSSPVLLLFDVTKQLSTDQIRNWWNEKECPWWKIQSILLGIKLISQAVPILLWRRAEWGPLLFRQREINISKIVDALLQQVHLEKLNLIFHRHNARHVEALQKTQEALNEV